MMFFWAEFAENWFGAGSPVKSLFAQTANTFLCFCVFRHFCILHFFILHFCILHFCIYQSPVKSFLAEFLFYMLNFSCNLMFLQIPIYIKLPICKQPVFSTIRPLCQISFQRLFPIEISSESSLLLLKSFLRALLAACHRRMVSWVNSVGCLSWSISHKFYLWSVIC